MNNPFEHLSNRLLNIESLLIDIKHLKSKNTLNPEPQEKILSVSDAAEFLGLSSPTIYTKVSKGEIPHSKKGNRLYFFQSELLEYLKQGKKKSFAEIAHAADDYLKSKKG